MISLQQLSCQISLVSRKLDRLIEAAGKIESVNWTLLFGRLQSLDEQYAAVLEWQRQVDKRLTDIESRLGELANLATIKQCPVCGHTPCRFSPTCI